MVARGSIVATFVSALLIAVLLPAHAWAQTPPTEAELLQRLSANPADFGVSLDLARLYQQTGRLAEAERMLNMAIGQIRLQRQGITRMDVTMTPVLPAPQGPIRIGGDIKEPKKIKDVKPIYPEDAKTAGIRGIVILECVIATDGTVREAKIIRSVSPSLDMAASDAVMQWEFTPTLLNGAPVEVIMTVTVNFSLNESRTAQAPLRIAHQLPTKTKDVKPAYPEDAKAAGITGIVILECLIDTEGRVSEVKVLRSVYPSIDRAAVDAVKQWQFTPTLLNGAPVPIVMTTSVKFSLD